MVLKKNSNILIMQILFLFGVILVPTAIPYKNISFFLIVSILLIKYIYVNKIYYSKSYCILLFSLLFPAITAYFSFFNFIDSDSYFKALIYITVQSFAGYYLFLSSKSEQDLNKMYNAILFMSVILSLLLLYESFFTNFYYQYFNITSVPETVVDNIFNTDLLRNKVSILGVDLNRPFGPQRYQLLAGYCLLFGALINTYRLCLKKSVIYLACSILFLVVLYLTSKMVLLSWLLGSSIIVYKSKNIPAWVKMVINMLFITTFIFFVDLIIIKPLLGDVGLGSTLERLSRIMFSLSTYSNSSIIEILFGNGLSYTWYGNEFFVSKYYLSQADTGLYVTYLQQGGIINIFLFIFSFIFIIKRLNKNSSSIISYAFIISTILIWFVISNTDLFYWLFLALGINESYKKLHS
ncbi:hypothetical protein ACP5PY_01630 [Photobacterium leiognathi subsp. mandapamensis]